MKAIISFFIIALTFLNSSEASSQENTQQKSGLAITANSKFNELKMSRSEFSSAVFSFYSYDQNADAGLQVKEFKVKYPGMASITINGNTLNKDARLALSHLKKGDQIVVFDGIAESSNQAVRNPLLVTLMD